MSFHGSTENRVTEAAFHRTPVRAIRFQVHINFSLSVVLGKFRVHVYVGQDGLPVYLQIYVLPDPLMDHAGTEIPPVGHSGFMRIYQTGFSYLRLRGRSRFQYYRQKVCFSGKKLRTDIHAPGNIHPLLFSQGYPVQENLRAVINSFKNQCYPLSFQILRDKKFLFINPGSVRHPLSQL